eukprot:TRINITY_DN5193_c1_g1_i1.p1 TRINITY_DN5193_c1_g1~~TRINITY_DN5193_c1_g1_i1.p1  ORF type:complete len:436 (+),score=92.09 TRINITY_DN5193_c1_g1_i1:70-1308(+)
MATQVELEPVGTAASVAHAQPASRRNSPWRTPPSESRRHNDRPPHIGLTEEPVSMSERELLRSVRQLGVHTQRRFPGARARISKYGRKLPARAWPAIFFGLQACMFACVVSLNTVVPPSVLLQSSIGRAAIGFTVVSMLLFGYLVWADPGYIRSKRQHARGDPGVDGVTVSDSLGESCAQKGVPFTYCATCCTQQPLRCRHCSICDRCIYTYDHHCWWLNKCIGGGNKRAFLGFLLSQCMLELLAVYCLMGSVRVPWLPSFGFFHQCGVCAVLFIASTVTLWNLGLLQFHLRLSARNETSFERLRPGRCHYLQAAVSADAGATDSPAMSQDESADERRQLRSGRSRREAVMRKWRERCSSVFMLGSGSAPPPRPFDQGTFWNLLLFCCTKRYHWEVPAGFAQELAERGGGDG